MEFWVVERKNLNTLSDHARPGKIRFAPFSFATSSLNKYYLIEVTRVVARITCVVQI